MEMHLPGPVSALIRRLEENGYEAYAVGGCVRDMLLCRTPKDYDVTTNALPSEIKRIFRRTVDTGIAHGTVTVLLSGGSYEVTTYRLDGAYEDMRHPKEVTFSDRLEEDLKRRDFTVNAMAWNPKSGLVDLFGGQEDLREKRIRCVGKASERFSEDVLRILRAVRFAAQLGFSIEEETLREIRISARNLPRISKERIRDELVKLLISDRPGDFRILYETGITAVILPWFDAMMKTPQHCGYHHVNVGEHTLLTLPHVPAEPVLRLAALLHDVAKPILRTVGEDGEDHFHGHAERGAEMAGEILRDLKFDNDTIRRTVHLIRCHSLRPEGKTEAVRRCLAAVGREAFPAYLALQTADSMAKEPSRVPEMLSRIGEVRARYGEITERGDAVTIGELAVGGNEMLALGLRGPEVGRALSMLLDTVLADPARNTKEDLLAAAAAYAETRIEKK